MGGGLPLSLPSQCTIPPFVLQVSPITCLFASNLGSPLHIYTSTNTKVSGNPSILLSEDEGCQM